MPLVHHHDLSIVRVSSILTGSQGSWNLASVAFPSSSAEGWAAFVKCSLPDTLPGACDVQHGTFICLSNLDGCIRTLVPEANFTWWYVVIFSDMQTSIRQNDITMLFIFNSLCVRTKNSARPNLEQLVQRLSREAMKALTDASEGLMYTKKVVNGRTVVTGGKKLKDSGIYTPQFGKRVVQLFKKGAVTRPAT